jgi:hypothetical protein
MNELAGLFFLEFGVSPAENDRRSLTITDPVKMRLKLKYR